MVAVRSRRVVRRQSACVIDAVREVHLALVVVLVLVVAEMDDSQVWGGMEKVFI